MTMFGGRPSQLRTMSVSIHPVALLHVSDYYTRGKIRGQKHFVGAFVGTVERQQIVVRNAFEVAISSSSDGQVHIDMGYFSKKLELYVTTFPGDTLVGWFYLSADQHSQLPDNTCLQLHKQILTQHDVFLLGLFDDHLEQTKSATQLPLKLYELNINDYVYRPIENVNVKIDTEEAERIAVEDVMREAKTDTSRSQSGGGTSKQTDVKGETQLANAIEGDCSALEMLRQRLAYLDAYIVRVMDGSLPKNHALLARINQFMGSMARAAQCSREDPMYMVARNRQTLEVLVEAVAASVTKGAQLNESIAARVSLMSPASPLNIGMGLYSHN